MKTARENDNTRVQLAHVEKEQVDIKADIRIMQHDITTIKENMATKSDIIGLNSKINGIESALKADISGLHHKIDGVESKLEARIEKFEASMNNNIGWLKAINIAVLATVLSIALAPMAQNMFKAPVQEVITDKK